LAPNPNALWPVRLLLLEQVHRRQNRLLPALNDFWREHVHRVLRALPSIFVTILAAAATVADALLWLRQATGTSLTMLLNRAFPRRTSRTLDSKHW